MVEARDPSVSSSYLDLSSLNEGSGDVGTLLPLAPRWKFGSIITVASKEEVSGSSFLTNTVSTMAISLESVENSSKDL